MTALTFCSEQTRVSRTESGLGTEAVQPQGPRLGSAELGGPQPRNLCLQWFNLRPPKRGQRLTGPFTALLSTYFLKRVWWPQPGEGLTPRGGRGRGGDLVEWLHSLPLFSVIFWEAWPASLHAERPLPSGRVRSGGHGVGKAWGGRSGSQPVPTGGQQTTKAAKTKRGAEGTQPRG